MLHAVPIPGDGNCLFSSVARILLDWLDRCDAGAAGASALPAPTGEDVRDVATYLRSLVATRVLDPGDVESEQMIETWRRLWADARRDGTADSAAMLAELQHLDATIPPPEAGPLTLAQRRSLHRNMMRPQRYWGDEFALRTLEAALDGRFCVVDERLNVIKRELNESGSVSPVCRVPRDVLPPEKGPFLGVLLLRHAHYEPASTEDGQLAWSMHDLPAELKGIVAFLRSSSSSSTTSST